MRNVIRFIYLGIKLLFKRFKKEKKLVEKRPEAVSKELCGGIQVVEYTGKRPSCTVSLVDMLNTMLPTGYKLTMLRDASLDDYIFEVYPEGRKKVSTFKINRRTVMDVGVLQAVIRPYIDQAILELSDLELDL